LSSCEVILTNSNPTVSQDSPRELRRSDFELASFRHSDNRIAVWQLVNTLVPTAALWWLIPKVAHGWSGLALLPILTLLVLLSARSFALMHDCGHGTLFSNPWLNRIAGFGLGCLNAIPQYPWSRGHAFHHKHNGNWQLYRGPSNLLTKNAYLALSPKDQWIYRFIRHPLMLFPGGFFYLIIRPRLQLILGLYEFLAASVVQLWKGAWRNPGSWWSWIAAFKSSHWYTAGEAADLFVNNLVVVCSWWLMANWMGAGLFWVSYSVVMTFSAAIFICIFVVQHNFRGSYAHGSEDWNYLQGAISGSSNLNLPPLLNWFSADIAFHSVHHLCERIPSYRLRQCHEKNARLLADCCYLKLSDIPGCFHYNIWDQQANELITAQQVA
jgi:omega-6 fatty acid desaturase (delta-12 desaturase)